MKVRNVPAHGGSTLQKYKGLGMVPLSIFDWFNTQSI